MARLVDRIGRHLDQHGWSWSILFVDDSDDETPRVIADLARAGRPVDLVHRPTERPGGLSGALTLGLTRATAPYCAVIDADLQHPPELLAALLRPLHDGNADVSIASRYVPGGSATGLDGAWRRTVSRGATRVAQRLFPTVGAVADPVSGYFALRRSILDGTDLRPEGFKMLVEILVRTRVTRVHEEPYHFAGRLFGSSKVTVGMGLAFGVHMWRLWSETQAPGALRRVAPANPAFPAVAEWGLDRFGGGDPAAPTGS